MVSLAGSGKETTPKTFPNPKMSMVAAICPKARTWKLGNPLDVRTLLLMTMMKMDDAP